MGNNKTPEYSKRATKNYISKFDMINLRLPKGTKERINKQSESINKFISDIVITELERLERTEPQKDEQIPDFMKD